MSEKLRIGVLFGGKSAEHEVSIQSAQSIINAIDRNRFEVIPIGIDRTGRWHIDPDRVLLEAKRDIPLASTEVSLKKNGENSSLVSVLSNDTIEYVDVVFPVLHGPYGEDGTVQGLLKLADIPYVGADVLGSAVGMDKDVMKRLLRDAGMRIAPFRAFGHDADSRRMVEEALAEFGLPLFIKPANLGSSVGITKAATATEAVDGVRAAFTYDTKVIIEKFIPGREIECSVLGNRDPIASIPGEIRPVHGFYSYEAKYIDENGAELIIPAEISEAATELVRSTAVKAFKVLCCSGLARVDMFLAEDEAVFVNEINTMPGFTRISMYPKLWSASGIDYTELISRLIDLAIERHREEKQLKTSLG
jgi:D-alanine-D-alanine ligase